MRCSTKTSALPFAGAPLALGLALALATAGSAQVQSFDPANPDFDTGTEGAVRIFQIGPYTVPAGRVISGNMVPGEYEQFVSAPNPGNVFMTGYDSRIVDANRIPQDPAVMYLHHAVLVNRSKPDLTCPLMPGERFAAAGAERIPFALPQGYGYRLQGTEPLICILHMQNFTTAPRSVYYQFSMTVQPGTAQLKEARPWWLDVVWCTSTYTVPAGNGQHVLSRDYTTPGNGLTMLTMGPHLHCGGTKLELIDKVTQNPIASYPNLNPCPVDMRLVIPPVPVSLNGGQVVTLRATYQRDPTKGLDAMGIMLGYVVLK